MPLDGIPERHGRSSQPGANPGRASVIRAAKVKSTAPASTPARSFFLAIAILLWSAGFAAAQQVGVSYVAFQVPERNAVLQAVVWYPAAAGGAAKLVGGNAIFEGTRALLQAPLATGRHPLVVLSFGGFRSSPVAADWLAADLAAHGFIIAVVNPPAVPDAPPEQSVLDELWLRPADLSAAIAAIVGDPDLSKGIDPQRVGAVGFFLGGYSVLELAGARTSPEALAHSCDGADAGVDCAWFASGAVDLEHVDSARLARSNLDRRIKAAIVVDPEFSGVLEPSSLEAISVPVSVINLTGGLTYLPALDASDLADEIPEASYETVMDSGPSAAFPVCTPQGAFMPDQGGIQLCAPSVRTRVEIHKELADRISSDLRRALKGGGS